MSKAAEILDYLAPFVSAAGAYSVAVQNRIDVHQAKSGPTPFHHALSDADLSIQSYLEVALLARYPEVGFFSEEHSQSLNLKYFSNNPQSPVELEVQLDPIDGTRAYIAQRTHYQIIVTIHDARRIVAAMCYMPRLDRCYMAVRGEGAFVQTHDQYNRRVAGTRLDVSKSQGPVLLFNRPDLVKKLQTELDVKDILEEFNPHGTIATFHSTDLLEHRAAAVIHAPAQAIDGGALAFIAEEAGAIVSDWSGADLGSFRETPDRTLPCVIAAANRTIHSAIVKLFNQ
jgi:myo-inositol-1(or 4)-monophosphatase